jgi:uridylate kinase
MDAAALSLCKDNDIPILVLNLDAPRAVAKAIRGEQIGTLVHSAAPLLPSETDETP